MAKQNKFDLGGDIFDTDLDLPDFNFATGATKNDRNPTTQIPKAVLSGMKTQAMSSSFIRQLINKALPRGYGSALDLTDQVARSGRNLYDEASKEIKPVLRDAKRITGRLATSMDGKLPKSVLNWVKKKTEDSEESVQYQAENAQELTITAAMADIFKMGEQQETSRDNKREINDRVRDQIEMGRHSDTFGQLDNIRQGIVQLTSYTSRVDAAYKKKSLELQFRHYFVASQSFEEAKRMNALTTVALESIMKNTGLPEYAKLRMPERLGEVMRNKFIDGVNDSVFGRRREFLQRMGGSFVNSAKEKISGFANDIRAGMSGIEGAMDMSDMMKEMGGGAPGGEIAGNIAGSFITDSLGKRVGKKLRSWTSKNETVNEWGNKLQFGAANAPQLMTDFARSDKGETGGMFDFVIRGLKDSILAAGAQDNTAQIDGVGNMMEPAPVNRQTIKSITEVIPGYLARIYRELQITRTGDAATDLTVFDYTSGSFTDRNTALKNAAGMVLDKSKREGVSSDLEAIFKKIDPKGTMTAEERKILGIKMLQDNMNNSSGSAKRMTNAYETYTGQSGKHATKYAELFEEYFRDDKDGSKQEEFARMFSGLGSNLGDARSSIQSQVNVGNSDMMTQLGILNPKTGAMDMNRLYAYYAGGDIGQDGRKKQRGAKPTAKGSTTASSSESPVSVYGEPAKVEDSPSMGCDEIIKVLKQEMETLANVTKENNLREKTESIDATLIKIYDRLEKGLLVGSVAADGTVPGGQKGPFWNRSLRSILGGGFQTAKKGFDFVSKQAGNILGAVSGAAGTVANLGKAAITGVTDRLLGIRDVFVKGSDEPRLMAWKIKAGLYRDQVTGKIIKSYKDMRGAIIDAEGNIVLTAEEMKDAFVKTPLGVKLISAFISGAKKISSIAGAVLGAAMGGVKRLLPKAITGATDILMSGVNAVSEFLHSAEDIYVIGRSKAVLLARDIKEGLYRSQKTGKIIRHAGDIDGAIIGKDGNIVLSDDDIKLGLVNSRGRKLRVGIGRVFGAALDVSRGVTRAIGATVSVAASAVRGTARSLSRFLRRGFGWKMGSMGSGPMSESEATLTVLSQIREILDERLPQRKKILGDSDGDGVREGSYADLLRKKKSAAEQSAKDKAAKPKEESKGLLGMLGSLFGKKKSDEGEGDTNIDVAGGYSGGDSDKGKDGKSGKADPKSAKPKGRWGKIGSGLAKAGGWGLKGLLTLGSFASLGSIMGVGGSLMSGAGALASGAMAVGGSVLGGLGAAAGVIGSILASPIVLGALAVAAVGVAGYYSYKYLTKKTLGPLSKIRYAQYGFMPKDTDHVNAVFGLEDKLMPGITFNEKTGAPTIDEKKVDASKMMQDFDIDQDNKAQVESWMQWFAKRFRPVFLTNIAALRVAAPDTGLSSVDSLKPAEAKKYVELMRWPDGPYREYDSPFPASGALQAGGAEVSNLADAALLGLAKAGEKAVGADQAKAAGAVIAGAEVAGATGAAAVNKPGNVSPAEALKTAGAQAQAGGGISSKEMLTVMGKALDIPFEGGKLDALSCVRFKAYGLPDMELTRVRSLALLERMCAKALSFNGAAAEWTGSVDDLLMEIGPQFGIEGVNNNRAYEWKSWFRLRFLPVYVNYASAVSSLAKTKVLDQVAGRLKPSQAVEIAVAIKNTTAVYNGARTPCWQIPYTPWPGVTPNSDASSVEENIQSLKNSSASAAVSEEADQMASDIQAKVRSKAGSLSSEEGLKDAVGKKPKSSWDSFTDSVSSAWNKTKEVVSDVASSVAVGAKAAYNNAIDATSNAMTTVSSAFGGSPMEQPGKGTAGDINSLPVPKGNKSYAALKDLIDQASKMVGVDKNVMAAMAAIESGFDYTVKAGTSSATGLYQFISGTWKTMLQKYGSKYGIDPNTKPTDPRANALMGGEFMKENMDYLKKSIGRDITPTDVYMAHFLGAGGAKKFLSASKDSVAASILPDAAKSNYNIFYKNGRPQTTGEVYASFTNKLESRAKTYGLSLSGGTTAMAQVSKGNNPSASTAPTDVAGNNPSAASSTTSTPSSSGDVATASSASKGNNPSAAGPSASTEQQAPNVLAAKTKGNNPSATVSTVASTGPSVMGPASDQYPGAASGPNATISTVPKSDPNAPGTPMNEQVAQGPDPSVLAAGGGFQMARQRDMAEQASYQRTAGDAGSIGGLLQLNQQIVDLSGKQLMMLSRIHSAIVASSGKQMPEEPPPPEQPAVSPTMRSLRNPETLTQRPVSMAKPMV